MGSSSQDLADALLIIFKTNFLKTNLWCYCQYSLRLPLFIAENTCILDCHCLLQKTHAYWILTASEMRFWHSGKGNTCATAIVCIQCNQGPSPSDQFWGFEYFFLNLCIQINNACPFQLINIQQVYLFLCSFFRLTAKINFYQPFSSSS